MINRQSKIILARDGAVRQLVGLITRRSVVQIRLPQYIILIGLVVQRLTRLPVTQEIAGSIPVETAITIMVQQLSWQSNGLKLHVSAVRLCPEPFAIFGGCGEVVNASDCGSDIRGFDSLQPPHNRIILRGCSLMAKPQPSKLMLWVRFPSPAPFNIYEH